MKGILAVLTACIVFGASGMAWAQNPLDAVEEQGTHDPNEPFLDVKLKLDEFLSEWWAVGLNYDCNRGRRRVQEANFNRKFSRRVSAVFKRVEQFGPDVAKHGHDVLAIGRCFKPRKGGGAYPANATRFETTLTEFESFLASRKPN